MKSQCFPATLAYFPHIHTFFLEEMERLGITGEAASNIELVIEEIVVNVVKYAYPDGVGDIEVSCDLDNNKKFWISIRDWGVPFNPIEHKDGAVPPNLDEAQIGGLGIQFARALSEDIQYERQEDANFLFLRFDPESQPGS